MKLKIIDKTSKEIGQKDLPSQFNEPVREDLIQRAVLAIESHNRQPYGAKIGAGMRASAKLSRRRHNYKGSYGHGISRVPRKIMSRSGTRFNWVGAVAPGTVGGRKAHPPKASKIWDQKINKKENQKAIRSAMAATLSKEAVELRGHIVPAHYPFIITSDIEAISKTKDIKQALLGVGLESEISRLTKKIRAGKGKTRGRKYKITKGPLIVVSGECNLTKAAANLTGIDIVEAKKLNAKLLAPGAHPGRLTLWTDRSIDLIKKEGLFQ
ncbi:MAG: 50S ribosomal protein L4 [Nanoarchaeota archaeon]|nr:50S ribosomal protein L4 [Nanoarchaeota archaeon]MBU1704091.1 50S ribosomal protein L4 [Nanoarchaeota archaeon]